MLNMEGFHNSLHVWGGTVALNHSWSGAWWVLGSGYDNYILTDTPGPTGAPNIPTRELISTLVDKAWDALPTELILGGPSSPWFQEKQKISILYHFNMACAH